MAYSIDTFSENIINVDEAAKSVSKLTRRKRNPRIIRRWMNRGISGVTLPAIRIGGELYTSTQALNWFFNEARSAKLNCSDETTETRFDSPDLENQAAELGI